MAESERPTSDPYPDAMDLFGFDPPKIDDEEIARIGLERYGIAGRQRRLRGERSHNTLFTTDDGRGFVLKVASATERWGTIEGHAKALVHLAVVAPELPVARMMPTIDGELVPVLERCGASHAMRLVTFMPGVTFEDDQPVSPDGLRGVGRLVGAISAALADFEHPALDGFMPWDIGNGLLVDADLWSGLGEDARNLLEPTRGRLEQTLATLERLPRQIIHNDAHAGNLLRATADSDVVTGVIDFGDLVRTATAADLGVSGANLVPHQDDPVQALAALVAGFASARPLADAERAAVPELVLARLALSTLLTDYQIRRAPHIAVAVADERPRLLANLERWLTLDLERVRDAVCEAAT